MSAKQKMQNKLNSMTADELFEIMRSTALSDDDAQFIIHEMATDIYIDKVPEETFIQAMSIIEKILDGAQ